MECTIVYHWHKCENKCNDAKRWLLEKTCMYRIYLHLWHHLCAIKVILLSQSEHHPISTNLFVSIVEIVSDAIRQNPNTLGLLLGTKEYKISQFADDRCLYLSDEKSLQLALKLIKKFAICSGLNLNRDKSKYIWIASYSNLVTGFLASNGQTVSLHKE